RRSGARVGRGFFRPRVAGALAEPERGNEIVGPGEAEIGRRLLDPPPAEQRRGIQPIFPRLALEQLAPELDRARPLLDLQPLIDLGPRPRRLDDLEPVAAGMLVR